MRANAKKQIVSVIFIVSLVLVSYSVYAVSAADSSIVGVQPGQKDQWTVITSSGVTTAWYSETFAPRGNFSLPVGSTITLIMTSVLNGHIRGNISFNGFALTNVSMSEISYNLLLGWYPFNSGLVCPIDWNVQEQNATSNGLIVQEFGYGASRIVTFTHLSGTVGTVLTYDKATGLLMSGYGSFGKFQVEVALIQPPSSEAATAIGIAVVAILAVIAVGWYGSERGRRTSSHS